MANAAPLAGRVALVTGVSRRQGIGFAIAERLLADGARVFATGWAPHDAEMPWGRGEDAAAALSTHERFAFEAADLEDPEIPQALVAPSSGASGASTSSSRTTRAARRSRSTRSRPRSSTAASP